MTSNNPNRIIYSEVSNCRGRVKHFNVRPYTRTSVWFNFSNLPDHVDVQLHTLYKITRYRGELHRKVYVLVEAAKEYTVCLARFYGSRKLPK